MSNRSRGDSGEFAEEVSDSDILELFDKATSPVLTARELSNELPITRSAVNHRLKRMQEAGVVDRMKAGANAVVWWAVDDPDDGAGDAAVLEGITGILNDEEAARFDERTRAFREEFDREMMDAGAAEN